MLRSLNLILTVSVVSVASISGFIPVERSVVSRRPACSTAACVREATETLIRADELTTRAYTKATEGTPLDATAIISSFDTRKQSDLRACQPWLGTFHGERKTKRTPMRV
mmetsp:Transcript_2722/g.4509  ORF Transcript_2722/g.4509 Transcript_2722/m.4509 type:complete len:110 (+) Transcript_2722:112-441(+)